MVYYAYWASSITGGTTGCLDSIDGTDLADKDMAIVISSTGGIYVYWLDEDNAGTESSPSLIAPDNNGGNKRWALLMRSERYESLTLATGVLTVTGPGLKVVCAESGTTDEITKIAGLIQGEFVDIIADTGDTITVSKSDFLKMPLANTLSGYKLMSFRSAGSDICYEKSRSPNT
jgi:hypothetical protein